MREADYYISLLELSPQPGPSYDADLMKLYQWDLRLGSVWPDIQRVLLDQAASGSPSGEPHNRDFNIFLLDQALADYPNDPWKVAFAVGNLLHNTGDLVSQSMLVQHLAVRGWTGELDMVIGPSDMHPGNEVESLVEIGLELAHPALDLYAGLVSNFLGSPDARTHLQEIHDFYTDQWDTYFSGSKSTPAGDIEAVKSILRDIRTNLLFAANPNAVSVFAASGLINYKSAATTSVDWAEVSRLFSTPVATSDFWDVYYTEGYFLLSPTIMLSFEPGQGYFDFFPNWSTKMMKSGSLQSLAHYLPGVLDVEDGRFFSEISWKNNDTQRVITSVDSDALPSSITLTVTFFDVPGRTGAGDDMTIVIREDSAGKAIVATATDAIGMDPWNYDANGLQSLSVTFSPSLALSGQAQGLFVELIQGNNPADLPYFTTDWSVYEQITEIDTSKAAYTNQYSTYGHWPYSLKINSPEKRAHTYQRHILKKKPMELRVLNY
jgi:hypothetical protein